MASSTSSDSDQESFHPEDNQKHVSDGVMNNDKDYTKDLARHLNQLRHENTLCDVTIIIDQRRFQAHKVVLCAASSYFSAMFTSGFQESSQSEVTIPEGSSEAFEKLLDFAYTGGLLLSATTITDIISMACYMQFNRAIPLCADFLKEAYVKKSIQPQDAFTILNLATSHQLSRILKLARNYLVSRFVEFSKTPCFLEEASAEYVESILQRKDLGLWATEEQILKAVVVWLKNDWENRQSHAASLLKHIKLGLVPFTTLENVMAEDIGELPECREMIADVEKSLALKDVSKVPMSVRYPEQFATRGTITTVIAVDPCSRVTECYKNGRCNNWIQLEQFPAIPFGVIEVTDHQLIVANNELYVAGGQHLDMRNQYLDLVSDEKFYLDHFSRYSRPNNKWIPLNPMLTKRSRFAMVHLNNHIYAIGGNEKRAWTLDVNEWSSVERYSLLTEEWEKVANLPVNLKYPSAIAYQDKILVYGVQRYNDSQGFLFVYDPETNTWIQLLAELVAVSIGRRGRRIRNFHPVLVMEGNDCYRVKYVNDVAQVNRLTLQLDNIVTCTGQLCSSHNPADQTNISGDTHEGSFCINKRIFVNLRGYIHRLNCTLESVSSRDTSGWEEINWLDSSAACINFTFDKYSVL